VTEPTPKSIEVARHGIKLSKDLGVKRQIVVVNKVESASEYQEILFDLGLDADLIYAVSYDREVVDADKRGALVMDYSPNARVVRDVNRIKGCLLEAK
jgi:CO dehydrogenase maturation factor